MPEFNPISAGFAVGPTVSPIVSPIVGLTGVTQAGGPAADRHHPAHPAAHGKAPPRGLPGTRLMRHTPERLVRSLLALPPAGAGTRQPIAL